MPGPRPLAEQMAVLSGQKIPDPDDTYSYSDYSINIGNVTCPAELNRTYAPERKSEKSESRKIKKIVLESPKCRALPKEPKVFKKSETIEKERGGFLTESVNHLPDRRKFKTSYCEASLRGFCAYGEKCCFAHSPEELRSDRNKDLNATRVPRVRTHNRYQNGDTSFRYNRYASSRRNQKTCRHFEKGHCPYGSRCRYLHNSKSKVWDRPPPFNPNVPPPMMNQEQNVKQPLQQQYQVFQAPFDMQLPVDLNQTMPVASYQQMQQPAQYFYIPQYQWQPQMTSPAPNYQYGY